MFRLEKIYEDLLNIDGRTYSKGEVDTAKYLYNRFLELDYFKEHPCHLKLIATDEDEFVRFNQVAMIEKGESKEAVVLINTMDEPALSQTISTSDIENLKGALATSVVLAERLSKKMQEGRFLIYNICDRYGSHKGMEAAVRHMEALTEEGIRIRAVITTHDFLTRGDRYVYFGAQALLRPAIFVAGKAVRQAVFHKGLDPAYLLSTIVRDLTLNSPLMERMQGEVSEPIYVNRLIVPGGTEFTTSPWGYAAFTTSSLTRSPLDYMRDLKDIVKQSYQKAMDELNTKYATYCLKRNVDFSAMETVQKVYTWDEYLNELVTVHGNSILSNLRNKKQEIQQRNPELPDSALRLQLVQYLYDTFKLADEPIVILYFEDFPYHRVDITGMDQDQRDLMMAFTSAINRVDPKIKRRFFYPEMSYHSYVCATDDMRDLKESLKCIPQAEDRFLERIRLTNALSIPTVNVGGATVIRDGDYGFDKEYQMEIIPKLIEEAVLKLLNKEDDREDT